MDKPLIKEPPKNHEFLEGLAGIAPTTLDAEKRTVDVVWFTGVDVPRLDWWTGEPYILRFAPDGADLSLLNNGAAVLDNHSSWDGSASQKGKVEKAWKENGSYLAKLRFSKRKSVDELWGDIEDRIVTKFSMGVEILESEKMTEPGTDGKPMQVKMAKKWRPYELSIAPIPADFGTTTLAGQESVETKRAEARTEGGTTMELQAVIPASPPAPAPVDPVELRKEGADQEAARRDGISERFRMAKKAGAVIEDKFMEEHLKKGTTPDEFGKMLLNKMAEASDRDPIQSAAAHITRDQADTQRDSVTAALLNRYDARKYPIEKDFGRDHQGYSLFELARMVAEQNGKRTAGKNKLEVVQLALSTSDFPFILENVAGKTLRRGYEETPRTFMPFCTPVSVSDFKQNKAISLGEAPNLELVLEGGEFHSGKISEARETYQVKTYGKIIPITRQAIINDDLGAFTRIPQLQGAAGSRLESDVVWGLITANANMADGNALFSAAHGNEAAGADIDPPDIPEMGAARKAMRKQTGLDGAKLNIVPRYILLPTDLETVTAQLLTNITPASFANVIPDWVRSMAPIIEPRLDADSTTAWYLAADPGQIDTIWYCYLAGQQGMFMETRIGFEVDGIELKARLDFGAAVIDWRGLYRNEGT